jgi:hypothetical protein
MKPEETAAARQQLGKHVPTPKKTRAKQLLRAKHRQQGDITSLIVFLNTRKVS